MKALILSGGKGTRLRPLTFAMAKQLVPVANKPVIQYGLESIIEAGIEEIGVIVGDTSEEIKQTLGTGEKWGVKITYIQQDQPLGLAHAVRTAQPFLQNDDFIMYLGDNLIKSPVKSLIEEFKKDKPAASILLTEVPNASDFGVAVMENGKVVNLEEKPKNPKSNLALVGVYIFSRCIHGAIEKLRPSWRGEYEITEAIQNLIDDELTVKPYVIHGWWKDTGTVDSMLEANRIILEDLEEKIECSVDKNSKIQGRVSIPRSTVVMNSNILGPAIIGENCRIENSYIGPFTAVADHTELIDTEVQNSIILPDCKLENVQTRIESSLLGRGAQVNRCTSSPKSLNLVIGDSGSVTLP